MGLAASQARLLTLTSRLSSIELKQQSIANAKILLANDSEQVSNKYTKALNNQTLKMSDGTNELAMTYDNLKSFGYDVKRTGDGVVASLSGGTSAGANSNASRANAPAITDPEILKWVGKSAPTPPEQFTKTPPTAPTQRLSAPTPPTTSGEAITLPDFNAALQSAKRCANHSYNFGQQSWNETMSDTSKRVLAGEYKKTLTLELSSLINNLSNIGLTQAVQSLNEAMQQADATYSIASSSANFGFNFSGYGKKDPFSGKIKTPENEYATTMLSALSVAEATAKSEVETLSASRKESYDSANAKYQADLAAYNQNKQEWAKYDSEMTVYNNELSAYNTKYAEYNRDYENWKTANSGTVNTTDGTSSAGGTGGAGSSGGSSQAQALAQQLKSNPQFLIQGLLSGYLTLTKDGQDVSISSATNILEQYDKTDDAAAEAEYNAQMAKINRKEKILDQQMKNLDTEHSAMQQEVESVKNIIKDHADKDFNLFG